MHVIPNPYTGRLTRKGQYFGCGNIRGTNISKSKTKSMAFKRIDPVRSKMVIYIYVIEQINAFSYLNCSISYQNEKDITVKVSEFLQMTGIIS